MKPIPLLDYIGSPILWGLFALLLLLQWKYPLRRRHFSVLRRLVRNFVMSVPAFVLLRLALVPIPLAHTFWAQRNGIGLLNWIKLPPLAAALGPHHRLIAPDLPGFGQSATLEGPGPFTFAWAGEAERGKRHYYRIQGPTFLVEYDNTQNDGNHVHSVWRDFNGDFGRDLLREHLKSQPH